MADDNPWNPLNWATVPHAGDVTASGHSGAGGADPPWTCCEHDTARRPRVRPRATPEARRGLCGTQGSQPGSLAGHTAHLRPLRDVPGPLLVSLGSRSWRSWLVAAARRSNAAQPQPAPLQGAAPLPRWPRLGQVV